MHSIFRAAWCAAALVCGTCAYAGGIMIYPKYILFDGKTNVQEVLLINPSAEETAAYRVSVKYMRQTPGGGFEEPAVPGEDDASSWLRYSPRSVTLGPKRSQHVKLLTRLTPQTPDGEYAAYLVFTKIITPKPLTPQDLRDGNGVQVKITPIPSFAVPVIVRKAEAFHAQASLEDAALRADETGAAVLSVRLRRTDGDKTLPEASVRGDVSVWDGDRLLAVSKGRYVLAHNSYADITLHPALDGKPVPAQNLRGKKLSFYFTPPAEADGAARAGAEASLTHMF